MSNRKKYKENQLQVRKEKGAEEKREDRGVYFGDFHVPAAQSDAVRLHLKNFRFRYDGDQQEMDKEIHQTVYEALVRDIYLCTMPRPIAVVAKADLGQMAIMKDEADRLMQEFGTHNVVCARVLPPSLQTGAIKVEPGLWLVKKQASIPLLHYIFHLKSGCSFPVLSELSGVPQSLVKNVYDAIIKWLTEELRQRHKAAEKYEQPVIFTTDRGFNIRNSEVTILM